MERIVLLLALVIMGITSSFAQNQDTVVLSKIGTKLTYTCNGEALTEKQFLNKTRLYPDAYKEMQRYRTNKTFGSIFSYTGAFIIGYSLGGAISAKNSQDDAIWVIAGAGATLIALGIPFYIATPKRRKSAIKLYNNHILHDTAQRVELGFGLTNYGIGLSMKF